LNIALENNKRSAPKDNEHFLSVSKLWVYFQKYAATSILTWPL